MKTLLLRRVGSTMIAGRNTAEKMLHSWGSTLDNVDFEDEDNGDEVLNQSEIKDISDDERERLEGLLQPSMLIKKGTRNIN
jgi:hypothetical protein